MVLRHWILYRILEPNLFKSTEELVLHGGESGLKQNTNKNMSRVSSIFLIRFLVFKYIINPHLKADSFFDSLISKQENSWSTSQYFLQI